MTKLKEKVSNIIVGVALICLMTIGMEMYLRSWEREMDSTRDMNNKHQIENRINSLNNRENSYR